MFVEPTWLSTLITKTKIGSLEHVRSWGLGRLLIVGKYISKVQFSWECLGALIELWHPQTHTFVFLSFEVTILLEELEILFVLRSSLDYEVACPLGHFHVLDVLGEFMNEQDARRITTPNEINLFKLSSWLMLHSSDPSVDSLAFAKGLSICLVRSLLFSSTVSFLYKSNVGMIREL